MKKPLSNMASEMFSSLRNKPADKVVFIDRDGVINRDSKAYIKSWAEFSFLPRSLLALKKLTQHRFRSYIITNQSAIHRKMMSLKTLHQIHDNMMREVALSGGRIEDIFFCPHLPEERCRCRKPRPGLVLSAKEKYHLDISAAYMIGDSAKDIECGKRAGCGVTLLVKTGHYADALTSLSSSGIVPDVHAFDLYEAAIWIIDHYARTHG